MSPEEVFAELKLNSGSNYDEAVRILVKIADNIIKNPNNLKVRSLQKNNSTIQNKVLSFKGGSKCLKLMGFQETETSFVMPSTVSIGQIERVKKDLINFKSNKLHNGAIPKSKAGIQADIEDNDDDLKNVKRFVLPPLTMKFTNSFLRQVEYHFHQALVFDDKDCQKRAKKLIPLDRLEVNAQKNLRYLQTKVKKEKLTDPEFSVQDMLLLELLTWFKEEFFTWVNSPDCCNCGGKTIMSHMSSDPKDLIYTDRVEVFRCETCQKLTKFPRYNDLNILLETRRGRCGEWAQVFTLLCRALDWDARYVIDELDHVWTEVYSVTQRRWVHCDPCENACDTPLIYESGWNKKLTYIIAYSPEEVQDVTWRYSSDHKAVLSRRRKCTESELVDALITLRNERQKTFSKSKQNYLNKRLISELIELMVERKPHENEKQGRISGSLAWRSERGEINNENLYIWKIDKKHIIDNKLTIKYSTSGDCYEFVKGDGHVIKVNEWQSGVFSYMNIFRKEEKDWKTVYLARNEGTDKANISWKYELNCDDEKSIDSVSIKFNHKVYENGKVEVELTSGNISVDFPKGTENFETHLFSGAKYIIVSANLSGGKGNVAWQHAQLFRQSFDSDEYPFVISITFKDIS